MKRTIQGSGDTGVHRAMSQKLTKSDSMDERWDLEYRQAVFRWAAKRVRKHFNAVTWEAFWRTAVDGRFANDVSIELGTTAGAVYAAKSRVIARLRDEIELLDGDTDPKFID